MSNNAPSWLNKWGRSPRQDRRVIEDGKFVELGKVYEPPVENVPEQEQSALEIVHEPANVPVREQSVSEVMQAELEPLDAVAEHEKGVQTIAEIVENLKPLPGDVINEDAEPLTPTTEVDRSS
ncbi:MAG TPA: hypothetical protein VN843_29275 [Anaerolineales bacterium]|nr:hypothetical protein [Anaerolineales bacterium]